MASLDTLARAHLRNTILVAGGGKDPKEKQINEFLKSLQCSIRQWALDVDYLKHLGDGF